MGGQGDGEFLDASVASIFLSRVEILDTSETNQWYGNHAAVKLPHPCSRVLPVTVGNMCYLLGGKVLSVCLDSLITLAQVSQQLATSAPPTSSPWQVLPDTDSSTALAFNGALLAVGGGKDIYHYQPSSN